jgi:hypothetical protein
MIKEHSKQINKSEIMVLDDRKLKIKQKMETDQFGE